MEQYECISEILLIPLANLQQKALCDLSREASIAQSFHFCRRGKTGK